VQCADEQNARKPLAKMTLGDAMREVNSVIEEIRGEHVGISRAPLQWAGMRGRVFKTPPQSSFPDPKALSLAYCRGVEIHIRALTRTPP